MPINIHILDASKDIRPLKAELRSITESAIASVKKLLSIDDVDVVLYDNPAGTIQEIGGIGGYAPNANTVLVSLDPRNADFKRFLKDELTFTIAHELHHTVRWQKPVTENVLLEALIFEGLADHFAMEVTGRKTPSLYSTALTPKQKEIFLNKAASEWHKPTYDHDLWFFGTKPEIIPRWAGYTLGFDLVSTYLRIHHGNTAAKLVLANTDIFLTSIN